MGRPGERGAGWPPGRPRRPGADLLARWLAATHGWRPSTLVGYRSTVGALTRDPLGGRRAATVTPAVLAATMAAWAAAGVRPATVATGWV